MRMHIHTFGIGFVCLSLALASTPAPAFAQACGDGTFDPQELCVEKATTVIKTDGPVRTVLASDVNADGFLDIVAVTTDEVYLRYGNATGLGPVSLFWHYAAVDFWDIATGDFDGDGDLDLAMADRANDRVLVKWNLGSALFSFGTTVPVDDQPVRVLSARLNLDARDDLVTLNRADQSATVLLAAGGGAFAGSDYDVGNTRDIALGDCDADGSLDLLYFTGTGTSTQLHARPNTFGFLGPAISSGLPLFDPLVGYMTPLSIVSGDLNADGIDDVSVSASWSRLAPAIGNGACGFVPRPYGIMWAWTYRQRMIDFDQNGTLDVAGAHGVAADYSVAWGNGAGAFALYGVEHLAATAAPVQDLAFGDFNGDGIRDVLIAASSSVQLQRGNP